MPKNSAKSAFDKVCELGKTCYCNPSFGERLSHFFAILAVVLLIGTIIVYLVYLNRNKLALMLAPKLYYDVHGYLPNNDNNNNNNNNNDNDSNNTNKNK